MSKFTQHQLVKFIEAWVSSNQDEAEYWLKHDIELVASGVDSADVSNLQSYYNGRCFLVCHGPESRVWSLCYPLNQESGLPLPTRDHLRELAKAYPGYDDPTIYAWVGQIWQKHWRRPGWRAYQDVDYRDPEVNEAWGSPTHRKRIR